MEDFNKKFNLFKFNVKLILAGVYFTIIGNKYRTEGCELLIPEEVTDLKFRGQFPINFYERQERKYLKEYLPKDATVLELGGCLGVVSCVTNKLLSQPERHVVVEANPVVVPFLERNRNHNSCKFGIENCMVSKSRENSFFIGRTILMSSNLRHSDNQVNIKGFTIREIEEKYNLVFDVLIMDIEGGELEFLRTFKDKLPEFRFIFMEVHPHKDILSAEEVQECAKIIDDAGLRLVLDDANFWILQKVA